ncbi:hypothetical protein J4437_07585 [Candidatus Woesearchaeota archaeon]|nr:hypothetical protein [Candidatus Woesearchaeota archaeon]
MATVLDVGLLSYFSVIFPVLLVFAIVYALLSKTKAIGEAPHINALVAIVVALVILLSDKAIKIINNMIPWFAVAVIFFILMIFLFKMFGMQDETLITAVKDKSVYWTIIGICLAIFAAAAGSVFGQDALEAGTGEATTDSIEAADGSTASSDFQSNIWSIMKNTKILGMAIIFTIAVFAIALLSS